MTARGLIAKLEALDGPDRDVDRPKHMPQHPWSCGLSPSGLCAQISCCFGRNCALLRAKEARDEDR